VPVNAASLRVNGTPSPTAMAAMSYNIQPTMSSPQQFAQNQYKAPPQQQQQQHPILTPSGRALAVGGKVQSITNDPMNPIFMFWPDNEPLPEPGQIRPAYLANIHVSCHIFYSP
jgi:hypothetical protein